MRFLSILALVLISFNNFSQNLNSGLVVCMPMNGNATDYSGYNNNGIVTNATLTSDRFGNPNSAYLFNGITSNISIPFSTSIDSIEIKDELTITAWCNVFSWYQNWNVFPIINKYNVLTDFGWDYSLQAPVGCPEQLFVPNAPLLMNICTYTAPGTTSFNTWNHYAITYSKSSGVYRAYKNGVLTTTIAINNLQLESTGTGSLYVGYSPASQDEYANGKIDELKVYCRALSPSEILAIYNGSFCCSAPLTPTSIQGNTTICSGTSVVYSVTPVAGAGSYTWSVPGGWTGSSATNTILTQPSSSGVLSISVVNSCGTSSAQTHTINVIPYPTVTVIGTNSICTGATLSLTASGANSYTWNNGSQSVTLQVNPIVTTSYTVTGTNSGCSNSAIKVVTVFPLPVLSVTGNNALCLGKQTTLNASGAVSYSWNNGATTASLQILPSSTTIYTLNGTNSSGCSATTAYTVTVNNLPSVNASISSQLICLGQTATISSSGANTYSWSNGAIGNSVSVSPTVTTNYTVIGQDSNGCESTASVSLIVERCNEMSLNENQTENDFRVFPNPVSAEFVTIAINGAGENEMLRVAIYSYDGKLISDKTIIPNFNQLCFLNISDLNKGCYTIFVSNQKHEQVFKLIKN